MSTAENIKTEIENYAHELRSNTKLLTIASSGKLKERTMALYLESLRYLFQNSSRCLQYAANTCFNSGNVELGEYFSKKVHEEKGHELWAQNDLAKLDLKNVIGITPAENMVALVNLQVSFIERNPLMFAAYAQWAEYFSVHVGDMWLDALTNSGYDRNKVTAIDNHLVTDRHHAAYGFSELTSFVKSEQDLSLVLEAIRLSGQCFAAFCNELCAANELVS